MKANFLQWYINNGGDVSQIDGNAHRETHTEPRQANKSLKRHNYVFERALSDLAEDIEVNEPEVVIFKNR
jgi:hypothetical protein